jgi:uncharacterized Fe-S cluster-containing protein
MGADVITAYATLLAAFGSMIVAVVGAVISLRASNRVQAIAPAVIATEAKVDSIEKKQDDQHLATNSRLDELLKVTGEKERAAGRQEVIDEHRAGQDAKASDA